MTSFCAGTRTNRALPFPRETTGNLLLAPVANLDIGMTRAIDCKAVLIAGVGHNFRTIYTSY